MRIVFDNQQAAIARLNLVAVVENYLFARSREHDRGGRSRAAGLIMRLLAVEQRQIQGEGTPFAWNTLQADFSAQQRREFARNRKAESRAAVFTTGTSVRLLEGLEDQLL